MESQPNQPPLIVVVGETASGKSNLALSLARQFNGEIISADSRTVYRGMDIGTAKPSLKDQSRVGHYMIDVAAPDEPITAAGFKRQAVSYIEVIAQTGKIPFLVGGTGLYVDSVLYDFSFSEKKPDLALRMALQQLSVDELQARLISENIPLPTNAQNPRHLVRQLETRGVSSENKELRNNTLVLGLEVERDILRQRIIERTDQMFEKGLVDEARHLFDAYGTDCPALQTIGYQEFIPYFSGEVSLEQVRAVIIRSTLQYAKRQRTWFKRNKSIHWICKEEDAVDLITTLLNNSYTAGSRNLLQYVHD